MPDTRHPLDPDDWGEFRALAHRVLDDMIAYLEDVRERPVWQPFPDAARQALEVGLSENGIGLEAAYEELQRNILPYAIGNVHPRFWGWVRGTGTPGGILAELITGTLNTSAWGGQQAAPYVEAQVLRWLATMLGYPESASGLLVSGCSMANLVALAVARDAMSGADATEDGLRALRRQPVLYGSTETHSSIEKAVGLLGMGRRSLRRIGVDADFRIDIAALERAIANDRAAGLQPIAVIGNAGTVNTGAVDDLAALALLCQRERLWLHVDGAFGALAALVPSLRPMVAGMEQADSLAFDLHKWLHIPYGVGCVFICDAPLHERPFHAAASYLEPLERGAAAGPHDFSRLGPELSRRFRALKVWMALRAHGTASFAEAIERNVAQARALAGRLRAASWAQVLAPVSLNVVCFRYVQPGLTDRELDQLNRRILIALQERGIAVPSATVIGGKFAIRVAIANHRSGEEDFDALLAGVEAIGKELAPIRA
jgi:glutamate/tyrosine decarboxylase-like PLP-dependent enzyme